MLKRLWLWLVLLGALLVVWKHQDIRDWWILRNYDPPAAIVELAKKASMSSTSRRYFYLAQPAIDEKRLFAAHCPVGELSLVLGCYADGRIYVLKVTRKELGKVMQVTAAHEMLHAAYKDLAAGTKKQVNRWLEDYLNKSKDLELIKLVRAYEKSEPGNTLNELHSLVGTQERTLPTQLENYYRQYFTKRGDVVNAYLDYRDVFKKLENQQKALEAEIKSIETQLSRLEASLNRQRDQINATNQQLDSYRSEGSIAAYNNLIPSQNAQVQAYNADVQSYKSLVEDYNDGVGQYNQIGLRQKELINSLDASKFKRVN